jgi:hypothetical protein
MLVENDCRKVVRLAALPLPPRSATNLLKLVCSVLSAELVVVEEPADVLLSDWIKLFRSDARPEPGFPPCEFVTLPVLVVPSEAALLPPDCDLRAASKLWTKLLKSAGTSVEDVVPEVEDVDAVLPVPEVALAVDDDPVTPIEARLLRIAAMRSPLGAPAGGVAAVLLPSVLRFACAKILDRADKGIESPELDTELTLIGLLSW